MMIAVKFFPHIVFVVVLSLALCSVAHPAASVPAGPEQNCCAKMAHERGDCPPPVQGPTGNCCNMPICIPLFLQVNGVNLSPSSVEMTYADFNAGECARAERPPVPPPRI